MKVVPFGLLISKEYPEETWLIEKLVPEGGLTVIAGYPASYKTWVLLEIAIKLAEGQSFFNNFNVKKSKVLIIDEENGERMLQKRFKQMTDKKKMNIEVMSLQSFKLKYTDNIIEYCIENSINAVIIDSLIRVHSGDENSSTAMSKIFRSFKKFKQNNISLIFSHHNRKSGEKAPNPSEDMRGSSETLAFVDSGISIRRNGKNEEIIVTQFKSRDDKEIKPFKVAITENDFFKFEYMGEVEEKEKKNKIDKAEEQIINILKENTNKNFCQKDIVNILKEKNIGESSIKIAINKLCSDDIVERKQAEGNKQYYTLKG